MADLENSSTTSQSLPASLLITPLLIMFLLFEFRFAGVRHEMRQRKGAGDFVPMPIMDRDMEDGPFESDPPDDD